MLSENSPKIPIKTSSLYVCEICDYKTSSKKDYSKHLLTVKHQKKGNPTFSPKNPKIISENINKIFQCNCGKVYKHSPSLSAHKKKCKEETKPSEINELITYLIKENSELKKEIKEFVKEQSQMLAKVLENGTHNTTNNNNSNNCHNKNFNLNVFLNEKCKDALNINEFIDSLKISLKDVENVGELGFVNGISKIFVNGLKELDVYKRPIHCSDLKRETMYLKTGNIWEKDNENNDGLKKAIKLVVNKNADKTREWKEANPQCKDYDSKKNDQYMKIICSSMGTPATEEANKNYKNIIKRLASETVINKE